MGTCRELQRVNRGKMNATWQVGPRCLFYVLLAPKVQKMGPNWTHIIFWKSGLRPLMVRRDLIRFLPKNGTPFWAISFRIFRSRSKIFEKIRDADARISGRIEPKRKATEWRGHECRASCRPSGRHRIHNMPGTGLPLDATQLANCAKLSGLKRSSVDLFRVICLKFAG